MGRRETRALRGPLVVKDPVTLTLSLSEREQDGGRDARAPRWGRDALAAGATLESGGSRVTVGTMADTLEWLGSLDEAIEVARRARRIVLVDYVKPG